MNPSHFLFTPGARNTSHRPSGRLAVFCDIRNLYQYARSPVCPLNTETLYSPISDIQIPTRTYFKWKLYIISVNGKRVDYHLPQIEGIYKSVVKIEQCYKFYTIKAINVRPISFLQEGYFVFKRYKALLAPN